VLPVRTPIAHFQLEHRLIHDTSLKSGELEYYVGMAQFALQVWQRLDQVLDEDVQLHMNGGLMVAETAEQIELLERKSKIEQGQGLNVELLDGDEARRIAPYLSNACGPHCPDEGH
jgi:glycine/D-amino acid oxidase-like deaminating enzyme